MNGKKFDIDCNSIENEDSFIRWRKRYRKRYLKCGILIFFMLTLVVALAFSQPQSNLLLKDLIFGIVSLIVFALLMVYCFYKWVKGFSLKADKCFYGIVAEKNRYNAKTKAKSRDNKGYFIFAECEGKRIQAECEYETYKYLDLGDGVLVFSIGTKKMYAISLKKNS